MLQKNFFYTIVLTLLSVVNIGVFAQPDAPTLECVSISETSANDNRLTWTNNHNCGPDFIATYIYESVSPTGPFTLKKTVNTPDQVFDQLTSPLPGSEIYYYLQVECASGVSATSDTISNFSPPSPNIIKASVSGGGVDIDWEAIVSSDITGYLIYKKGTQIFELVDTVYISELLDPSAPSYTDVFADPSIDALEYSISSLDFCGNSGAPQEDAAHTTIFLQAIHDSCTSKINLQWSPYLGWDSLAKFEIIKGFDVIDEVPGNVFSYEYTITSNDPTPLPFIINGIKDDNITNTNSNTIGVSLDIVTLPTYIYMTNASVVSPVNENQIQLQWVVSPDGSANDVYINRSLNGMDFSKAVDLGPLLIPPQTIDVDNSADTQRDAYYYTISAENECGVAVHSDTARTIFLSGQDNFNLSNTLSWNEFELKHGDIQQYILYRFLADGSLDPIAFFLPGEEMIFTDDVSGVDPANGNYCYKIECQYDLNLPGSMAPVPSIAFSNSFCLSQTSRIFVPTAFSPNGVNSVFKPEIVFPNSDDYNMIVLNRWGEKLFETNDPQMGWDGYVRGELAPQGVYPYVIEMVSTNGNQLLRKGTVLLLR